MLQRRLEKKSSSSLRTQGSQKDPSAMTFHCRTNHENTRGSGDTKSALDRTTLCQHCHSWLDFTVLLQLPPRREGSQPPQPAVPPRSSQERCWPQPCSSCPRGALSSQTHSESCSRCPKAVNGKPLLLLTVELNQQCLHHLRLLNSCPCLSSGDFLFWGKDSVPVPLFNRPQLK